MEEFFGGGTEGQHTIAKFTPRYKGQSMTQTKLTATELTATVTEELSHIPRGDIEQNIFRSAYNMQRLHDLSEDPSKPKEQSFLSALQSVRAQHERFTPAFDGEYFSVRI
jgi:hypothetical protein